LLFSGDLDVRTPLEEQAEAVAGLANLHQVIIRNGGHDLFEAHPDITGLLVDFFSGKEGDGARAEPARAEAGRAAPVSRPIKLDRLPARPAPSLVLRRRWTPAFAGEQGSAGRS
jgi:hypothetical protein